MEDITIIITEKELSITKRINDAVGQVIVHEFSQVPTKENDEKSDFNRLRDIALREWYRKCVEIIRGVLSI